MYVFMWFRISVEFLWGGSVVDIKVIQRENIYWDESNEFELTRLLLVCDYSHSHISGYKVGWYLCILSFLSETEL